MLATFCPWTKYICCCCCLYLPRRSIGVEQRTIIRRSHPHVQIHSGASFPPAECSSSGKTLCMVEEVNIRNSWTSLWLIYTILLPFSHSANGVSLGFIIIPVANKPLFAKLSRVAKLLMMSSSAEKFNPTPPIRLLEFIHTATGPGWMIELVAATI